MQKYSLILLFMLLSTASYAMEYYFTNTSLVLSNGSKGEIPQAPRIGPDGKSLYFEFYTPDSCSLWLADADGADPFNLTSNLQTQKKMGRKVENIFCHPNGKWIVFNETPAGVNKNGRIFVAELSNRQILRLTNVSRGARAQFSKPGGTVLYYESTETNRGFMNVLKYSMLGDDPFQADDTEAIGLRGPVWDIAANSELSHPSLAPDGSTILFAARTSALGGNLKQLNITDGDRQQAYLLWNYIIKEKIPVSNIQSYLREIRIGSLDPIQEFKATIEPELDLWYIQNALTSNGNKPIYNGKSTVKVLVTCWFLGLLLKLDNTNRIEIERLLNSRLYVTDIFGAPITPLVNDSQKVPLPQKWATVSHTGRFAVFEAGVYTNRHLFAVNMATRKAVKLTEVGTYNSSPEISPDERWIYFESDRRGKKDIWRAQIDPEQILAATK